MLPMFYFGKRKLKGNLLVSFLWPLSGNHSCRNSKLSLNYGFTMIELLSVVVIIGLVAAMAVPRFQIALERIRFESANRELISTLLLARSYSISTKTQHGVYFNGTFNNSTQGSILHYTLFKDTKDPDKFRYDSADSIIRINTLSPSVTFMDNDFMDDVIIFTSRGTAQFSGNGNIVTMAITPYISASYLINVLPATGFVKSLSYTY
ncbi:MAG: prepilin-type N-terminal cleavage/methylation domain-containing protein [candidate division Zixibacteria bacterium]|nr:prepilin-type N-terminal cleavage/methylation domain-containing protein [candidate division Zixibacteria bacterium]